MVQIMRLRIHNKIIFILVCRTMVFSQASNAVLFDIPNKNFLTFTLNLIMSNEYLIINNSFRK